MVQSVACETYLYTRDPSISASDWPFCWFFNRRKELGNTHSARLGDMEITLTAARIASDKDIQDYGLRPRAGYKEALVFLRMKNVAAYPSCSYLDEWMHVKQGYAYPRAVGFKVKSPDTINVLPTEESSGEFAPRNQGWTEPASLKVVRNAMGEELCAMSRHRETRVSGPSPEPFFAGASLQR